MDGENKKVNIDIDFTLPMFVTLIFLVLKYFHVIEWDWVWIFTPFYVYGGILLIMIMAFAIMVIITNIKKKGGGNSAW